MAKVKSCFQCQQCQAEFAQWHGRCPGCQLWDSLVEVTSSPRAGVRATGYSGQLSQPTRLVDVCFAQKQRIATGIAELDHVLGGGLVAGSAILIGGDPGVGKSTLLLQIFCRLAQGGAALYVSGEESLQQIALRAQRLQLPTTELTVLAETQVERMIEVAERQKPIMMVVDSIQTAYTEQLTSAPGGVGQVRESAAQLVQYAKQRGIILFLVGHVTKDGTIAGPRVLEHMVDSVLYFEGERHQRYRMIRAVKNRFGAVNELGVFAMTDVGLKEVKNPSAIFLSASQQPTSGSIVMVSWEGSRPILVDIQALVNESALANPRRVTVGLESNRLAMLLAILHRHVGVASFNQDVFVNAVGGLRIQETGADLAIIAAVLSSFRDRAWRVDDAIFGEVGLSGEIRPVPGGQERVKEAVKQGFRRILLPKANMPKTVTADVELVAIENLSQLPNYL